MEKFPFLKTVALMALVLAAGASAQESDKMSDHYRRWVIVNEFGNSKVYVDRESISRDGRRMKALVRYSLNPPGTDKRNGRSVPEMYMTEEYDLEINAFRVHSVVFQYEDGTTGEPLISEPEWKPATGGNEKTLEYLRTVRQDYVEVIGGIDFPHTLSGFELQSVVDNEKTNHGLGVSLLYNTPGVKVSIFVYDHSQRNIPEGINSSIIQNEFAEARGNVQQAYPDAQIVGRKEQLLVAGVPILQSVFQYTVMKPGSRDTVLSHLYLTARKGNFVKVRATYSATDRPEIGRRIQIQFIEALCQILAK